MPQGRGCTDDGRLWNVCIVSWNLSNRFRFNSHYITRFVSEGVHPGKLVSVFLYFGKHRAPTKRSPCRSRAGSGAASPALGGVAEIEAAEAAEAAEVELGFGLSHDVCPSAAALSARCVPAHSTAARYAAQPGQGASFGPRVGCRVVSYRTRSRSVASVVNRSRALCCEPGGLNV